jgi:hypothetical protein
VQQKLVGEAGDGDFAEEVTGEVGRRPRHRLERQVDDQAEGAPQKEGHDHAAEPAGALAPVVVPRGLQIVEEQEAGDGEQHGRRPAHEGLRDQVLDESRHARRRARVGGVLAQSEAVRQVVGVDEDHGRHRQQ